MKLSHSAWLLLPLTLAACSDNDNNTPPLEYTDAAVIATRAPDYSSGAVSLIDTDSFDAANNLAATTSDISVRSGGDHYFLIEKYGYDTIKRYDPTAPNDAEYAYSTLDADDTQSSNPYDLIIASDSKAYLLRYGASSLWIVNPAASTEAEFKLGEIDLSAYDDDGIPEMSAGVIRDGKLYVTLQRLQNYAAVQAGYVAVIDVDTDTELDTQPDADGLAGIELPLRNPSEIAALPDGRLLIGSDGGYDGSFALQYKGGIATLDTSDYSTTLLIDDGDASEAPYGQITTLAAVDDSLAYFVGSTGYGDDQTLYRFDPGSSDVPVAVEGLASVGIGPLAVSPAGQLWIGRTESSAPGITVLDVDSDSIAVELIDTVLTPLNIDFVTMPATTE